MSNTSVYELEGKAEIDIASKMLNVSAVTWLTTAILGQWLFAYYILVFYGGHAVQGDWAAGQIE